MDNAVGLVSHWRHVALEVDGLVLDYRRRGVFELEVDEYFRRRWFGLPSVTLDLRPDLVEIPDVSETRFRRIRRNCVWFTAAAIRIRRPDLVITPDRLVDRVASRIIGVVEWQTRTRAPRRID